MNAKDDSTPVAARCAGEALLDLLRRRGVQYLFANSGTDFASLSTVEDAARRR